MNMQYIMYHVVISQDVFLTHNVKQNKDGITIVKRTSQLETIALLHHVRGGGYWVGGLKKSVVCVCGGVSM